MRSDTDCFGLNQLYFDTVTQEWFNNLQDKIEQDGFCDYSGAGLSSFLGFRYPVLNHSMFDDITRLDSGESFIKNATSYDIKTAWKPVFGEGGQIPFGQAKKKVEDLLLQSIARLIENKKRIGVTLSGGLDSSLIAAMVKQNFPDKEVYTYTCGFYGDDEFEYARIVAGLYSDKHTEFVLYEDDFLGNTSILPDLIRQKCAPLHPNELGLAVAESKAKEDACEIVLCGEGADDIFGGYGQILRMYLNYSGEIKNFPDFFFQRYLYFSVDEIQSILKEKYFVNPVGIGRKIFEEDELPENIQNQVFYFIQRIHTRGLVERGLNALKYNGFGQGFVFADPQLVDYVNALPFNYKIKWKEGVDEKTVQGLNYKEISEQYDIPKYMLKVIAESYLPGTIIYRKKKGFPVPFEKWLSGMNDYPFNKSVFHDFDLSAFSGLKKFMLVNLNTFIELFSKYKK